MASSFNTSKPFLGATNPNSHLSSYIQSLSSSSLCIANLQSNQESLAASSTSGNYFRVTTFGESHGGGLGYIVDCYPPRIPLSEADLQVDLDRRRIGQTPRTATDIFRRLNLLSNYYRLPLLSSSASFFCVNHGTTAGVTTGTPIHVFVPNTDERGDVLTRSQRNVHGLSAGGGRSSARETIGRVIPGAIAKKILKQFSGTEGLDIAIEGEKPDDVEEKEWKRINRLACALEEKFLKKSGQNKLNMKKRLFRFNYVPDLALMLMGSLPDEFEYLETTLLHGKVDVCLSEVTAALYSYELRKKDKQENTSVEAEALVVRGRSKSQNKGRRGRSKSKSRLSKDEYSDFALAATPSTSCSSSWLLDSVCSHHMTPNREWFFDFKELKGGIVYTANNSPLDTLGIGSIRLRNQDGSIRTLTGVHYVPDLMRNLIFVGTLESKGLEVRAKDGIMRIISGALVIMKGIRKINNVYYFLGSTIVGTSTVIASTDEQESETTRLWHMRLGHVGEKSLKLLIDQGLLKGARACKLAFCEHCIKGKKTRVKFGTAIHDTKGILDYVHSDVWGPFKTTSLGGTHYYVTFVDDFSRRVWVYTMKTKDEVLGFFLKWKKMVETQTGRKIKRLRTDNGGEYKNDPFLKVCEEEGIVRYFTIRSTPQQNGVAERMNRTLVEKVRCMLSNAGLGKEFWAEALVYACHLVNLLPSTTIGGKTPLEKWFGVSTTDYDSLHVFGFTAYYHVKESKLDPRAKKAIFMGITSGVKGYRLWCPETKKIIFSRDVTFDESTMLRNVTSEKLEQTDGTPKQVEFEGSRIYPASKETDVDSPMVEEESDEEEIQTQEPPQQHELIALRKGKRTIRQPARYADMVSFASPIAIDDVPATFNEAVQSSKHKKWRIAMNEEMQSLQKNQTWKLASLLKGKKAIGCKWVYAKKDGFPDNNNICYKARLVAKGYAQTEGVDYNEVFSPVVKHSSIRILLALVAQLDLELVQMDVKTAFLHGDLDEEIYMTQPDGFKVAEKEEMVCKLEKSLYGLKQSPRQWEFEMKDLGEAKKILGMKISRDKKLGRLCLSHKEYLRKVPYPSVVGSLMYAMVCTRPDISQAVGVVSRYMHDPGNEHWEVVKWILRYILNTVDVGLVFQQDKQDGQCVVGYCDSDYAGDLDKRRSTTGYVFTFTKAPVSWKSTLQSTVALSTTEAEYMSITEVVKEAIWLQGLFGELGMEQKHIKVHCDSQSVIHLAKNQVYHARTKHIDVRYHFVREILEECGVIIQKIRTTENPADMLKKVTLLKIEFFERRVWNLPRFLLVSQVHQVVLPDGLVDHDTVTLDQIESSIVRCPNPEYTDKMMLEAELAKPLMSVHAIKGFEAGSGFAGDLLFTGFACFLAERVSVGRKEIFWFDNMKFMKLGSKPDMFRRDGNNVRYVASELATDIAVTVGDVKFYLHKFPLLSKSVRLQNLVVSGIEENCNEVQISDIPGGPVSFEICAKFCYGMAVNLNAHNVVATRCAAEYLGMYETIEKGNLIYKIDIFLDSSIFHSWKDSIVVLQTTKSLLPLSEELKVASLCIDAIASNACIDVSKVDWSYTYNQRKLLEENGNDPNCNDVKSRPVPKDWWVEDLCELEIDLFKRVITSIKTKGILSLDLIGEALKAYSYQRLRGVSKGVIHSGDIGEYRSTVDTMIWLLPAKKGSVSCSFLLNLLKAAIIVDSGNMAREQLRRRIGQQLEEASVNDLLIRAAEGEDEMYDVDTVQKILKEFLMQEQTPEFKSEEYEIREIRRPGILTDASKLIVAKLMDAYLAEIAKDSNLPLSKFVDLAETVSYISRPSHDRLYRAIDMYLKAPLRVVIQVLFFEQSRAAAASSGSSTPDLPKALKYPNSGPRRSSRSAATDPEDEWDAMSASEELRALRAELPALRLSNGIGASTKNGVDQAAVSKKKGPMKSKRMFTKI
ncbi:BTB/POZ domain-containing protein NPY2 [Hibiscus syriacus]|uniref:chorismate synthase n=1 Tax=Hibiscus syriacus TaxID=106335 RepID=A0A6A3CT48_HIBSY|nr:BTB/POZ domain-containing protein NPY2 [Hibiscus syriacus]